MAKTSTRSKSSPTFKCSECGWTTIKWVGRCGECQAWGTVEEVGVVSARTVAAAKVAHPAKPIAQIDGSEAAFSRAFSRMTGQTPGRVRRAA